MSEQRDEGRRTQDGVAGFYCVAAVSLLVSVDTSWRFFRDRLGITSIAERSVMFAVLELAFVACTIAMHAQVKRPGGKLGQVRIVLWALCGVAAYMAIDLSGFWSGIARVVLGPLMSMVMVHLALGIEIRARRGAKATTVARVLGEIRERLLSRIGLADDARDALTRTRERAARRAAKLATVQLVLFRRARLDRAIRLSGVAHDPAARAGLLAELAAAMHAKDLRTLKLPSPWQMTDAATGSLSPRVVPAAELEPAPTENGGEQNSESATSAGPAGGRPDRMGGADPGEGPADRVGVRSEPGDELAGGRGGQSADVHPEPEPAVVEPAAEPVVDLAGKTKTAIIVDRLTEQGADWDSAATDEQVAAKIRAMVPAAVDWSAKHGVVMDRNRGYDAVRRTITRRAEALASAAAKPASPSLELLRGGESR